MNDKNYAWVGFCNIIEYCIAGISKFIIYVAAIVIGLLIVLIKMITIPIFLLRKLGGDPNTSSDDWILSIGSFPSSLVNKKSTNDNKYKWGGSLLGIMIILIIGVGGFLEIKTLLGEAKQREIIQQEIKRQEFQKKLEKAHQEKEEFKKEHPITYKTIEYSKDVLNYIF